MTPRIALPQAIAFCAVLGVLAMSAPAQTPPAAAAPETHTATEAANDKLDGTVTRELERLKKLQEELATIEAAPLPSRVATTPKPVEAPAEAPTPKAHVAADIPSRPVPGAEEEFANMLYAVGKYERARQAYQRIVDASPPPDRRGWALLQIGNCARRAQNYVAALTAYSEAADKAPDTAWATEAAWWTGQVKWRLLWNEKAIQKLNIPKAPATAQRPVAKTPAPKTVAPKP